MKLLGWVLGLLLFIGGIDDIATVNRLKKQAEEAYQKGDYTQAVQYYQLLVDSMQVQDERVRLNLAHAQLHAGDTATAQRQYSQLMNAESTNIKSVAYQQLGNITTQQQQYQDALAMYKESLKANPANEDARYNYELVKKLQKEQEQQQEQSEDNQDQSDEEKEQQEQQNQEQNEEQSEQQQDQEGESTDEQNQEQQQSDSEQQEGDQQSEEADPQEQNTQQGEEQSEGEKSEEEMSNSPLSERLEEMNISEEKARMILEAMRNNEMQYIQQNRRKPTKPKDRSKPDW